MYPNNYPQNTFLENLKAGVTTLLDRVRITNIVGELGNNSTINTIRVVNSSNPPLWENGYPDGFTDATTDRGLERGLGDGTVPKISAEFIISDINRISSEHSNLPTSAEGLVYKKLTGRDANTLINNPHNLPNLKLLIIKILSPVDVEVIAPDGKRIGKNFVTGEEFNEVDGAFYSGFLTDDEYITIPNPLDGEYKIETQGTGSGEYTVATGYIADNVLVDKDFTAQTQPGMITELNVKVNNANPQALDVKPTDITPPTIVINSPQTKDYLRSEILPINVNISDASGVFFSKIQFDDRIVSASTSVDLFFEKLGNHKISTSASDFVGNATSAKVEFRIIVTPESVISDIERAFVLGWIFEENKKDNLVKEFQKIIKFEKRIEVLEEKLPNRKNIIVERIEKRIDKILGKLFLKKLEKFYEQGYINDRAYDLLKEDISWLLDN